MSAGHTHCGRAGVPRNAPENRKSRCEIAWRGVSAREARGWAPSQRLGAEPSASGLVPAGAAIEAACGNSHHPRPAALVYSVRQYTSNEYPLYGENDARSSGSKAIPSTRLAHTRGAHMAWIMPSGLTWLFIVACAVTVWVIGYGPWVSERGQRRNSTAALASLTTGLIAGLRGASILL